MVPKLIWQDQTLETLYIHHQQEINTLKIQMEQLNIYQDHMLGKQYISHLMDLSMLKTQMEQQPTLQDQMQIKLFMLIQLQVCNMLEILMERDNILLTQQLLNCQNHLLKILSTI